MARYTEAAATTEDVFCPAPVKPAGLEARGMVASSTRGWEIRSDPQLAAPSRSTGGQVVEGAPFPCQHHRGRAEREVALGKSAFGAQQARETSTRLRDLWMCHFLRLCFPSKNSFRSSVWAELLCKHQTLLL